MYTIMTAAMNEKNDGNIEIPDFEVESACEHFEARVWLNKGVTAEISDIRITKR